VAGCALLCCVFEFLREVALLQAAVEGALSTLASLADDCPEVRRAAGVAGAIEILAACLCNATIGERSLASSVLRLRF
jgi:hypothetical protein